MATKITEAGIISTATACQLLMLSRQRIDQLAADGILKRHAPGQWRTVDVVQSYIRYLRDEGRRTSKSAADSRVRDARASEIELKTSLRKREVITLDEADESMSIVCGAVRTELGSLPARYTRDIAERRRLEIEVGGCLGRICAVLDAQSKRLKEGDGKGRSVVASDEAQ